MNKLIAISVFLACVATGFSQPKSGIKLGTNYSFYQDNEVVDFTPKLGYQFGYAWGIHLNPNWVLSIEGLFNTKSANVESIGPHSILNVNEKRDMYYFSVPVGINYSIQNGYLGAGYEFFISTDGGNLPVNDYNHDLFLQLGYAFKYFDLVLKYSNTLNTEQGGELGAAYYYEPYDQNPDGSLPMGKSYDTTKGQTLQLSVVINFWSKK